MSEKFNEALKAALKQVGKSKEQFFALSPAETPVLYVCKRPVITPERFKKIASDADVEIDAAKIWVGTVKKESGKFRFMVNENDSKGAFKLAQFRLELKKVAKALSLPVLARSIIVTASGEMDLVEDVGTLDAGLAKKRGRYKDVAQALSVLENGDADHKKRAKAMTKARKGSSGFLHARLLGGKKDRDTPVDAVRQIWQVQKMAMLETGDPPSNTELEVAAILCKKDLSSARKALKAALSAEPVNQMAAEEAAGRLEDLADFIDAILDGAPSSAKASVDALTSIAQTARTLSTSHGPALDGPEVVPPREDLRWTKQDRGGRLEVPAEVEVIEMTDPGVKMVVTKNTKVHDKFDLSDAGTAVKKGDHCVLRTLGRGVEVAWVETYTKEKVGGKTKTTAGPRGYANPKHFGHHKLARRHKKQSDHLFDKPPAIDDIQQGALGDCYLVAAIAAVAKQDPNAIADMIRDNGDGTCTVRLFQVQRKPSDPSDPSSPVEQVFVKVDKTTHSGGVIPERALSSMWVQMIEKAYAGYGMQLRDNAPAEESLSYRGSEGGFSNEPLEVLLGKPATHTPIERGAGKRPNWDAMDWVFADTEPEGSLSLHETYALRVFRGQNDKLRPPGVKVSSISKLNAIEADARMVEDGFTGAWTLDYDAILAELIRSHEVAKRGVDTITKQTEQAVEKGKKPAKKFLEMLESLQPALDKQTEQLEAYKRLGFTGTQTIDLDKVRRYVIEQLVKSGAMEGRPGSGDYTTVQQDLATAMHEALAMGRTVCAGTPKAELMAPPTAMNESLVQKVLVKIVGSGEEDRGGLVATHAYTVTGIDLPKEGEKGPIWVHLRNPWGKFSRQTSLSDEGELVSEISLLSGDCTLELGEFFRNYDDVEFC